MCKVRIENIRLHIAQSPPPPLPKKKETYKIWPSPRSVNKAMIQNFRSFNCELMRVDYEYTQLKWFHLNTCH